MIAEHTAFRATDFRCRQWDGFVMAKKVKPLKPTDRASAPRFKVKKLSTMTQGQAGKKAALKSVNALTNAEPMPEHFSEFLEQVRSEHNDRGAAILSAANTETPSGMHYQGVWSSRKTITRTCSEWTGQWQRSTLKFEWQKH
jgi:hypothetical protein